MPERLKIYPSNIHHFNLIFCVVGSEAPRSVKKSQLDALQALSGVLSPATFEKTK